MYPRSACYCLFGEDHPNNEVDFENKRDATNEND